MLIEFAVVLLLCLFVSLSLAVMLDVNNKTIDGITWSLLFVSVVLLILGTIHVFQILSSANL